MLAAIESYCIILRFSFVADIKKCISKIILFVEMYCFVAIEQFCCYRVFFLCSASIRHAGISAI